MNIQKPPIVQKAPRAYSAIFNGHEMTVVFSASPTQDDWGGLAFEDAEIESIEILGVDCREDDLPDAVVAKIWDILDELDFSR